MPEKLEVEGEIPDRKHNTGKDTRAMYSLPSNLY